MIPFLIAAILASANLERQPPTPSSYWIWPTLTRAIEHSNSTPIILCITQVPDGFATEAC